MDTVAKQEQAKYEKVWEMPEYSLNSPGARHVQKFVKLLPSDDNGSLVLDKIITDFGCGTGRASRYLAALGYIVYGIDIANNSLEFAPSPSDNFTFIQQCLWDKSRLVEAGILSDYGYCTDVMEHIPTKQVDAVLEHIRSSIKKNGMVYFNISTVPDKLGGEVGEELHLTVQRANWWCTKIGDVFGSFHKVNEFEKECIIVARNMK